MKPYYSNAPATTSQNLEAEKAALGAVLVDNSKLVLVKQLNASDFFFPLHQRIFSRMLAMNKNGQPIDLVLLHEEMQAAGEVHGGEEVGYIASLADGMPRLTNVEHYVRVVKDKAKLRQLAYAGDSLSKAALEGNLHGARKILTGLAEAAKPELAAFGTPRKLATAEEFLKRSASETGDWLAESLLHMNSYTIWQGRPKVGKSHTLLQLAFDLACGLPAFGHFKSPRPVRCVYVELEEPEPVTKARFAAILRANGGRGPNGGNLHFLSREDVSRWRILPRELLGANIRDFVVMLKDVGAELVVLVALRKFLAAAENLKDPDVAERFNEEIEVLRMETESAIVVAHHDRKNPADTIEAQGFGSTFLSAAADGILDLERGADGVTRKIRIEARYSCLDCFYLAKKLIGDGEAIQWVDVPVNDNSMKLEALKSHMRQGKSLREAAEAVGLPRSTASRLLNRN